MVGRPQLPGPAETTPEGNGVRPPNMIRLPQGDEPANFVRAVALVMYRQMQAEGGCNGDGDQDACEHEGDDPGGANGSSGRRAGDSHGVDEDVRDEEEELHESICRRPV